jgi:hypothetical protein
MALLAEELVEEWLNRQGYFTIRGLRCGVHEIDILAVRPSPAGIECRHIEVQASMRPISYLTDLPKAIQKATGRKAKSTKARSEDELLGGVREWIAKKFDHPEKVRVRNALAPGPWTRELVIHIVRYPRELELLRNEGIAVTQLTSVVRDLKSGGLMLEGAVGAHLSDLVSLADQSR